MRYRPGEPLRRTILGPGGHILELWLRGGSQLSDAASSEALTKISRILQGVMFSVHRARVGDSLPTISVPDRAVMHSSPYDGLPCEITVRQVLRFFHFLSFKLPSEEDAIVNWLVPFGGESCGDLLHLSRVIVDSDADVVLHWRDHARHDLVVRLDRRTQRLLGDVLQRTMFETRRQQMAARLVGVSLVNNRFELETRTGTAVGRIADGLVETVGSHLGREVVATLEVTTAESLVAGRVRECLMLVALDEPDGTPIGGARTR